MLSNLKKDAENKYSEKKYSEAARGYLEAAKIAEIEKSIFEAAELKNNASVAFLLSGENQSALDVVLNTEKVFFDKGNLKLAGMALGNQASAYEALGKHDQALELYEKAAKTLDEAGEKNLRVYILKQSSSIKLKQGRYLESLASMNLALQNNTPLSPKEKILKKLTNIVFKLIQR